MNKLKLKPLAKAVPADPRVWLDETLAEVRGWMASLGANGWTMARIAAALGCSDDSLRAWRDGEASMPVVKWKALRALAADVKRRTGT